MARRVAVTGVGLVTPLGIGAAPTWAGLLKGESAVERIAGFDPSGLRTQVGAELRDFDAAPFVTKRKQLRSVMRVDLFALAGARLAVAEAGLDFAEDQGDPAKRALFLGSGKETCEPDQMLDVALGARSESGTVDFHLLGEKASTLMPPLIYVEGLQAGSLFYLSEAFGLMGANTFFAGTAESGATAIGSAFRSVRRGESDVVIAGGYDDPVAWWPMSRFDGLGFMTAANSRGAGACRPFDSGHDGTVMGEGAALLVLEPLDAARDRGATVIAELVGVGHATGDGTLLASDAGAVAAACRAALRDAGASPSDVTAVVAHGSGVPAEDAAEARGLADLLGSRASDVNATSVKGALGHLGAAAGALNVGVAALALRDGVLPAAANLDEIDPACAGPAWVQGESVPVASGVVLAVAIGMHGQVVALALRPA